jgi:HD-like signal output (HDOD) protein
VLQLFKRKPDPKANLISALGDATLPSFPNLLWRVLEKLRNPEASMSEIGELLSLDPGLSLKLLRTVNCAGTSVRKPVADLSFTAGLLQDMALPLLTLQRPVEYAPVLAAWHGGDGEFEALERQAMGSDHAEVGDWMGESWAFPAELRGAIGDHHGGGGAPVPVNLVSQIRDTEDAKGQEFLLEGMRPHYGFNPDRTLRVMAAGEEQIRELSACSQPETAPRPDPR